MLPFSSLLFPGACKTTTTTTTTTATATSNKSLQKWLKQQKEKLQQGKLSHKVSQRPEKILFETMMCFRIKAKVQLAFVD